MDESKNVVDIKFSVRYNRQCKEVDMKIKIRERRLVKGLTQQELADKCGCSRQFINQIEADGSINVSSKLLYKIAEALECPIDDIFFGI